MRSSYIILAAIAAVLIALVCYMGMSGKSEHEDKRIKDIEEAGKMIDGAGK